jgi:hypothetical protein
MQRSDRYLNFLCSQVKNFKRLRRMHAIGILLRQNKPVLKICARTNSKNMAGSWQASRGSPPVRRRVVRAGGPAAGTSSSWRWQSAGHSRPARRAGGHFVPLAIGQCAQWLVDRGWPRACRGLRRRRWPPVRWAQAPGQWRRRRWRGRP